MTVALPWSRRSEKVSVDDRKGSQAHDQTSTAQEFGLIAD